LLRGLGYKPLVGTPRYATTRQTDALGRIAQVDTGPAAFPIASGSVLASRAYTYDAANQRAGVEFEDGRRWADGYDDLGQVTSAEKRLADNATPLPGYSFGYSFDDIGNRTQTVINDYASDYTPDLLNRYASRQVALYKYSPSPVAKCAYPNPADRNCRSTPLTKRHSGQAEFCCFWVLLNPSWCRGMPQPKHFERQAGGRARRAAWACEGDVSSPGNLRKLVWEQLPSHKMQAGWRGKTEGDTHTVVVEDIAPEIRVVFQSKCQSMMDKKAWRVRSKAREAAAETATGAGRGWGRADGC
jgi:YD repeat-containing protein